MRLYQVETVPIHTTSLIKKEGGLSIKEDSEEFNLVDKYFVITLRAKGENEVSQQVTFSNW